MSAPTVYLAGPIFGRTWDEGNDWRFDAQCTLSGCGLLGISPLRDEPLVGRTYGSGVSADPRHSGRGILEKNLMDLRRCDIVLAFLPLPRDAQRQSWGTIGEVFAARAIGKPVVLVSDDPSILDYGPLVACAGWVVSSLEEGVDIAVGLLSAYNPS